MVLKGAAGGIVVLCLFGPLALAAEISQRRLGCFNALVERQAPLSEYTFFLGRPEEFIDSTCYGYDTYFGALKFACLEDYGRVVSGGGRYSCGVSFPALIRHSYGIAWRTLASAEERRILRCE